MVIEKFSIKDAVWIETGTFKGDTTAFLAGLTHSVITIEPDDFLFKKASLRFSKIEKVTVVHGKSETELIKITENLAENCNFWLDGHYSGEGTFMGEKVFPINEELEAIRRLAQNAVKIAIFIDDVSFINPITHPKVEESYLNNIVLWAIKNEFSWTIENDIVVLQN